MLAPPRRAQTPVLHEAGMLPPIAEGSQTHRPTLQSLPQVSVAQANKLKQTSGPPFMSEKYTLPREDSGWRPDVFVSPGISLDQGKSETELAIAQQSTPRRRQQLHPLVTPRSARTHGEIHSHLEALEQLRNLLSSRRHNLQNDKLFEEGATKVVPTVGAPPDPDVPTVTVSYMVKSPDGEKQTVASWGQLQPLSKQMGVEHGRDARVQMPKHWGSQRRGDPGTDTCNTILNQSQQLTQQAPKNKRTIALGTGTDTEKFQSDETGNLTFKGDALNKSTPHTLQHTYSSSPKARLQTRASTLYHSTHGEPSSVMSYGQPGGFQKSVPRGEAIRADPEILYLYGEVQGSTFCEQVSRCVVCMPCFRIVHAPFVIQARSFWQQELVAVLPLSF